MKIQESKQEQRKQELDNMIEDYLYNMKFKDLTNEDWIYVNKRLDYLVLCLGVKKK